MERQAMGGFVLPKLSKTRYFLPLITLLVSVFIPLINIGRVYAGTDDYPDKWKNIAMDSAFDSWGEYNRECTSFVAWRLSSRNGYTMPFHDNAINWAADARARSIAVDSSPAKGAVAYNGNHVAWVEDVSADKSKVTIEEYNEVDSNGNGVYADDGTYSERTVTAGAYQYIHFRDLQSISGQNTGGINAQFVGSDVLTANETLWAGQYILSQNVLYLMVMQGDGNLVLYGGGMRPLWSSGTAGSGANRVVMQGDGNLVIYTPSNRAVWNSRTAGKGSSSFYIQNDGNAAVYNSSGPTWTSGTGGHPTFSFYGYNGLPANQIMRVNQYIKSDDGRYAALLQGDGNLVLYGPAYHVLWSSGTSGSAATFLAMQPDGNLVLYTSANRPVWNSHTAGQGYSFSVVQSDGNFVIYNTSGISTWNTETAGKI
jgi:surface antigen